MTVTMYASAIQFKNAIDKSSLKKGRMIFKNMKGEMKFGIQFEKSLERGFVMSLFESEEEMASRETISQVKSPSMVDSLDALVLSKEITISFIEKNHLTTEELAMVTESGVDVSSLKRVPYFDFRKQLGVYDHKGNAKLHKFVDHVFSVLLVEENFKLLCHVWKQDKKNYRQHIPVMRYNQRTKVAKFQDEYESIKQLGDFEAYRWFYEREAAPLLFSELGTYGHFKAIKEKETEESLNYAVELKFGISPLQYIDQLHSVDKKMTLQVADSVGVIEMLSLKDLDAQALQLAFLEVMERLDLKPLVIITRGFFGRYLKNVLTPVADRLGMSVELVGHLPTLDKQTIEEKINWIAEREGLHQLAVH